MSARYVSRLQQASKAELELPSPRSRMKKIDLSLAFGESLLGLDEIGLSVIKVDSVRLGQVLMYVQLRAKSPRTRRD